MFSLWLKSLPICGRLFLCPFPPTFPFGFLGMQGIKEWLQSPGDYLAGITLFEAHSTNAFLIKLFRSQGPTPYNVSKLKSELQKLMPAEKEIAPRYVPVSKPGKHEASTQPPPKEDQHREYLILKKQLQTVYRQLDHNIAALNIAKTKEVRKDTAFQILALHRKKIRFLDEIEYYDEHGCFPEKQPEKEITTPEMQRLYVQIWKAEKTLSKPECRNREKTEKLLAEKRQRLEQLKQQP